MTLTDKIKKLNKEIKEGNLINRRGFITACTAAGLGALVSCDKTPTEPDPPPNPNNPVNIRLVYRNHTLGIYGERTIQRKPREQFIVKARDIGGGQVDENRVAVREFNFGRLLGFTDNRDLALNVPNTDKTYEVYGFNIASGADYNLMDLLASRLSIGDHNFAVYRRDRDGKTGPERLWEDVFNQLNNALIRPGGGSYGFIDRRPNGSSGKFSYGYGIPPLGGGGGKGQGYIIVHPDQSEKSIVAFGLGEALEYICGVEDIGEEETSNVICDDGSDRLNPIGRDLFAYVFVKE